MESDHDFTMKGRVAETGMGEREREEKSDNLTGWGFI
jgi:hypothetical protein